VITNTQKWMQSNAKANSNDNLLRYLLLLRAVHETTTWLCWGDCWEASSYYLYNFDGTAVRGDSVLVMVNKSKRLVVAPLLQTKKKIAQTPPDQNAL